MRKQDEERWPKVIGTGLAYVQHGIDTAVKVGVGFLEGLGGEQAIVSAQKRTIPERAAHVGKTFLRFVGRIGSSYFEEYEKLKRKERF
ncbi:hypothetical protein FJZ28_02075 [Candidatus Peregrinibacteria bacterium]|nr:hypothetical protein [Candidatus Peregrinibacteria bacterium]